MTRPLRVAVVVQDFEKGRGYIENALPRYLARAGVDVHLLTMDLSPGFPSGPANERGAIVRTSDLRTGLVEEYDGYTLHVHGHRDVLGYPRMLGMQDKLRLLRPDIVQTKVAIGWIPFDVARLLPELGFKLFTGNHTVTSSFALARKRGIASVPARLTSLATRWLPGRFASSRTERCWAPTVDAAEIAWRFFGVERSKVELMYLGVDTDAFFPVQSDADHASRARLRQELGFGSEDIVCINTGKMSRVKNPRILADAISDLRGRHNLPFRGLFIGEGEQRQSLETYAHSRVLPMMHHNDLAPYYRAADIGVWPTNESISNLDATACGLPLIISDMVIYRDHVDGNGLVYHVNDRVDLVNTLLKLVDPAVRATFGVAGAAKMRNEFSWTGIAARRLAAYERAI